MWPRENINFRSSPTPNIKTPKQLAERLKKLKKLHYGFISGHNKLEKAEKEWKWNLSFRFVPSRNVIENSTDIAKKFKKLKNKIMASFQAKIGR